MLAVVDYGAGNMNSVRKAFAFLGTKTVVARCPEELAGVDRIVLPGVGAFGRAAERLRALGFDRALRDWAAAQKPLLGICLGLQLFFESSEESPRTEGLGLLPGTCRRLQARKVPQVGWNTVRPVKSHPLFEGRASEEHYYFVHGFAAAPGDAGDVLALTDYEGDFCSAAGRGRTVGVQFHPEKSGRAGLELLRNWMEQC